jgi:ABC-type uncharacterized transport system substrate-binding protein
MWVVRYRSLRNEKRFRSATPESVGGQRPPTCRCKQSTKIELVINVKIAKALGLDIPPGVLAIVDEVTE